MNFSNFHIYCLPKSAAWGSSNKHYDNKTQYKSSGCLGKNYISHVLFYWHCDTLLFTETNDYNNQEEDDTEAAEQE